MNKHLQDELELLLDQELTNLTSTGRDRLQELLTISKHIDEEEMIE